MSTEMNIMATVMNAMATEMNTMATEMNTMATEMNTMATVIVIHLALSLSLHEDELPLSENCRYKI